MLYLVSSISSDVPDVTRTDPLSCISSDSGSLLLVDYFRDHSNLSVID